MKKNQDGFSAVETVLILVIVGLIGFVGWYVYNSKNKSDATLDQASKSSQTSTPTKKTDAESAVKLSETYTDPSGFTLKYPADWQFAAKGSKSADGQGEFGSNEFVSKANYQANSNASILMLDTDTTTATAEQYAKDFFANKESDVVNSKSSKTNGYDTQTVNHKSPTGSPTVYTIFVVSKGKVVQFSYFNDEAEKDNVPIYEAITRSIKFAD
ncbi:MAG: hypothetical protein JWO35_218 [Candidatus Saccharibacteria bacterium]|nr:hypothetical protein [Candidatus Saccharibacteria bacterium]